MTISTANIYKAIGLYIDKGYAFLDVPYIISEKASKWTRPIDKKGEDFKHLNKFYAASAEQSFIELSLDNKLPKEGKFMALTPCYRTEAKLDDIHQNIFLKLELIYLGEHLEEVLGDALQVLSTFLPVKQKEKQNSFDLEYNNIEVGSYGVRTLPNNVKYTYGTGFAEPRMSKVIKIYEGQG